MTWHKKHVCASAYTKRSKGACVAEASVDCTRSDCDHKVAEAHSGHIASELVSHLKTNSCSPKPFERSYSASGPRSTSPHHSKLLLSLNVFS